MSSLPSSMTVSALEVGQTLAGSKGRYLLTKRITGGTHNATVFKADVLSGNETLLQAKSLVGSLWAAAKPGVNGTVSVLIKTAAPDDQQGRKCLRREYIVYRKPSVAMSPDIRPMYDVIGDLDDLDSDTSDRLPCLVFEWLDFTLTEVPSKDYRQNCVFLKAIVKAGLSSLVALLKESLMNTDLKPDNILLSKIDTNDPVVKIGDLDQTYADGSQRTVQPFAMRAPEVYQGLGCYHGSTVWALFATLICWIQPGVFGASESIHPLFNEIWSIARLMRLFPDWTGTPDDNEIRQSEFSCAKSLSELHDPDKPDEKLIKVSTLDNEMQNMGIPQELRALFRRVFIVDPKARPSAAEVLESKEFLALEEAASASQMLARQNTMCVGLVA